MSSTRKKFNIKISIWLGGILALIILIALSVNSITLIKINSLLNNKIAEAEEAARPAELDLVILNEASCGDCFDVWRIINTIKEKNIKINSKRTVEISSQEGKELIKKFQIAKAPTFIISGEIEKEASLKKLWPEIGEIKDGSFVFRRVGTPYVLVSSGEVKGRIKITMLKDSDCATCHNVTRHISILSGFGLPLDNQETVEANSSNGKELVRKYKIKLLPTIILIGDIDIYPSLKKIWPEVGTTEKDGAYVFREGVKNMGAYKNLTTGKIIEPKN